MNTEPLRRVQEHIIANPDTLDMDSWAVGCGTFCCIGGFVCELNQKLAYDNGWKGYTPAGGGRANTGDIACRILNLPLDSAMCLWDEVFWPEPYRARMATAKSQTEYAQTAAEFIQVVIDTNGEILAKSATNRLAEINEIAEILKEDLVCA